MKNVQKDIYQIEKIELLKNSLIKRASSGESRYFKVLLDGICVVDKTNDVTLFDTYEDFMDSRTKELEVQVYSGNPKSNWHQKYIYAFHNNVQEVAPLNGTSSNEGIKEYFDEKLSRTRLEWELSSAKEKIDTLNKDYKELEEYADAVEAENNELKEKLQKEHVVDKVINLAASGQLNGLFGGMVSKPVPENPSIQLSGDKPKVRPSNEQQNSQNEVAFIDKFNAEELPKLFILVEHLSNNKHQLNEVMDLLGITTQS